VNHGEPPAQRRGDADRDADRDAGRDADRYSRHLRLRRWPYEPDVAVVIPTDHQAAPSPQEVLAVVETAHARGFAALRTGALFPRAAAAFAEAGFHAIDTLALLDVRIDDAHLPAVRGRTRPLHRWHHTGAALVDVRAFGAPWGNDATTLGEIRAATPVHRARRVVVDATTVAFCMSGAAGRTGYLQRLAVDPRHQRRGLASLLVADALGWMRRRGLFDAVVNTGVDNGAALALYEGFGFRRRPEVLVIAERSFRPPCEVPAGDDVADAGR
jgi:ribosomal protein S18 acetylase RimI-like enzyme